MKKLEACVTFLVSDLLGYASAPMSLHLVPEDVKLLRRLQRLQRSVTASGTQTALEVALLPVQPPLERGEFLKAAAAAVRQKGVNSNDAESYSEAAWERIRANGVRVDVGPTGAPNVVELYIGL